MAVLAGLVVGASALLKPVPEGTAETLKNELASVELEVKEGKDEGAVKRSTRLQGEVEAQQAIYSKLRGKAPDVPDNAPAEGEE